MLRISTQMITERSLNAMLRQQNELSDTQQQLSTGRRVLKPSDDPASASRVLGLNGAVDTLSQYQSNIDRLTARLETEDGALEGITNLLQRVREQAVAGNNDVLTTLDKRAIAAEIRQIGDQLFSMANSRDSGGEYIFAGYQSGTRPFSYDHSSGYSYNGDSGQRELQIAPDRTVADGDNGFDTFMDIATGPIVTVNVVAPAAVTAVAAGDITIDGGNGNGAISIGALPPAANPTERVAQLRDAINAISGQTGVRAESNTAPPDTLTLTAVGGTGVTVNIAGTATTANTGLTTGTTAPVTSKRSVFETLDQLATDLEAGNSVDQYIADVQLAMDNIIEVRTTVGSRLSSIEEQQTVNEDLKLNLEVHRSEEQDLDYTEAISRFESQMTALQAAQQAYVKVKGLSLFNYL